LRRLPACPDRCPAESAPLRNSATRSRRMCAAQHGWYIERFAIA
jgi:hypothetical protein